MYENQNTEPNWRSSIKVSVLFTGFKEPADGSSFTFSTKFHENWLDRPKPQSNRWKAFWREVAQSVHFLVITIAGGAYDIYLSARAVLLNIIYSNMKWSQLHCQI